MGREQDWPLSWFPSSHDLPGARWLARNRRGCLLTGLLLMLLWLAVFLGAMLLHGEGDLPARAKVRLDEYLAYAFPGGRMAVAAIDRAAYPSRLTVEMAGPAFGSSVHFQTDLGASDIDAGSLSPLPFPPAEVWCVWLDGNGSPAGQVVLVAKYLDPYVGDWIVHQGPDDVASVEAHHLLSTLGCTLAPEPGDFDALDRVEQNGHGSDASVRTLATLD
ncbi:MAG: hypothetical protein JXA93_26080 [Anaerolineae bacterium]|nr:hypothetical protein [Anaerolineae bacterium]